MNTDIWIATMALVVAIGAFGMFIGSKHQKQYRGQQMSPLNMMPVEVHFKPSGSIWIASCPSLDVVTQGESFDQAHENLTEALTLFFESCIRRGTLEQVLQEAGYEPDEIRMVEDMATSYINMPKNMDGESCRV